MSLRMIDFGCNACGAEFELMIDTMKDSISWARCACGELAGKVIRKAPSVRGEENVDRDRLKAARSGLVRGAGDRYIPSFKGSTRSELRAWEQKHGLVAIPTGEIKSGRAIINTKTPFTKTHEFRRKHEATMREAMALAKSPEGDALNHRLQQIQQPNEFDKKAFASQATAGVVAATADAKTENAVADVAQEIAK